MSERLTSLLILALLGLGSPLQGQERERLARREAELAARLATLQASLVTNDSIRFADQKRTVVSAGAFHVAYPEWAARDAELRLPELLDGWRARYGVMIDSLLGDTLYIGIDDSAFARGAPWAELEWRMGALGGRANVALRGATRQDWPTWIVTVALEKWAQSLVDPTFAHWLGASDPSLSHDVLRDGAIRGLVLSPSSRGRRCLDGMIDDCALLLELRPVSEPWLQAYDSVDYPGLVERRGRGRAEMEWSRCVAGKDVGICAGLLRNIGPDRAATPAIRQSLFTFAVKRGGEVAWLRLRRAAGRPVADQLTSASGEPIDLLLGEWRRDLREGRQTTAAGLGPILLMALAWSVLGSLFFAWRYRWRHV